MNTATVTAAWLSNLSFGVQYHKGSHSTMPNRR